MNMHSERFERVRSRIKAACEAAGRNVAEVELIAVSKLHSAAAVRSLYSLGQRAFGENRLQEALAKQRELTDLDISWHFIGPVQSNKTREIAGHFDWVQSLDRLKVINRLSRQRPEGMPPLNVCLQVNIDGEPQKAGAAPGDVWALAESAAGAPRLCLRGLMCIPRLTDDEDRLRRSFARMRELFLKLRADGFNLDTLSMGMSADLEIAVAEGSTMVRVGTDLFGPRGA